MASNGKKDAKGRNLRPNEDVMPNGRYRYRYTVNGERKCAYSWRLVSTDKLPKGKRDGLSLREKEKLIQADIDKGIDATLSDLTLNDMWDKYIGLNRSLKQSTRNNYIYCYDHFVRNRLGKRKVKNIRYSDVFAFYNALLDEGMKINSLDSVHTLIHPALTLAVRDGVVANNVSSGVMAEMKKGTEKTRKRHALTVDEQTLLMEFLMQSDTYRHWFPLIAFLLGTGCRIGEAVGITDDDIDFENGTVSINHAVSYRRETDGKCRWSADTPKTESGTRTIPLFGVVRDALKEEYLNRELLGLKSNMKIGEYADFVFLNRYGDVHNPMTVNRALKRIYTEANEWEKERAKAQGRQPVAIRHFSAHNLRHTFCTRLCEVESNLRLIMDIMGHTDIQTTMNIYNEIQDKKKKEAFDCLEGKMKIL